MMDSAGSIGESIKEKRNSITTRINKMREIIEADQQSRQKQIFKDGCKPSAQWIIWCHLNDEQKLIEKTLKEMDLTTSSIYGALSIDETERRLYAWLDNESDILISKPEMLGSGCNLQQCHRVIFVGIRYQFEEMIQAIHRVWRYLQENAVEIHILYTDAEDHVKSTILKKWEQHKHLIANMTEIVRKYGLVNEALKMGLQRSIGTDREEARGKDWVLVKNDCVEEMKNMADNSVDLIHTSIPFGNHYEYSASYNDFGHNPSDEAFWKQMDFLIPDLLRILKPGRIAAIHAKDRLLYGHQNGLGVMSVDYFSDECNRQFKKHGFIGFGRITVVTDVVRENSSTYRLGWTENSKDSTKMGVGMPEYILLFRKRQTDITKAYADEPVKKDKGEYTRSQWQIDAHSFWRSSGNRLLKPEEIEEVDPEKFKGMEISRVYQWFRKFSRNTVYDYKKHVEMGIPLEKEGRLPASFMAFAPEAPQATIEKDGSSVWTDINFMKTLNTNQSRSKIENHVCPMSFDIVERIINRYSNPGELVVDPFCGLGTVPMIALRMGRKAYGVELAWNYWQWSVRYLEDEERKQRTPNLFDLA
jgi:DNA modification methylase